MRKANMVAKNPCHPFIVKVMWSGRGMEIIPIRKFLSKDWLINKRIGKPVNLRSENMA